MFFRGPTLSGESVSPTSEFRTEACRYER